jgi:hypothetical protein
MDILNTDGYPHINGYPYLLVSKMVGPMRIRHAIWIALFSASAGSITTYSLMLQQTDAPPSDSN